MKILTLIRHAKSSWDDFSIGDHDRPLNPRGQRDAPRVSAALKQWLDGAGHPPVEHCLTSTALRAKTTAEMFAATLGDIPVEANRELYLASPETMLRQIGQVDESLQHIAVFAHNPGMHHLAQGLLKKGAIESFPTAAVAVIAFDEDYWGTLSLGTGRLIWSVVPRDLKETEG